MADRREEIESAIKDHVGEIEKLANAAMQLSSYKRRLIGHTLMDGANLLSALRNELEEPRRRPDHPEQGNR